ncbi:MAG: hypothetical protein BECKG1743D_GA0114223_103292 [Candidatus Kentron sp. G]|nr:MAG: hypothetical protein BECKG1743F_GA0114225_101772 [Candidatus Kentron sp. G]VFM98357.1 MAG: hypothetical protein BECKG1743E_GA0114224_101862 [Candidatus Kentron sp. G]VFN02037.1 MAG: hypothetical protein BECKG1743D_GA0114223_103292 [Candidatus Kentron sp. G]
MKIGVDLDNTLIDYDEAFPTGARRLGLVPIHWRGTKKQLKDHLCSRDGGEGQWQRLQGQVYGRWIGQARLFDGVYRFLWRCRERRIPVEVVSHKTEYGHQDANRVPLRTAAVDFLSGYGIHIGKGQLLRRIHFSDTRDEKIRTIAQRGYDWFIDDLPQILTGHRLPSGLGRILFDAGSRYRDHPAAVQIYRSWAEIGHRLLGGWTDPELHALAETVAAGPVGAVTWHRRGGGNAGLLHVSMADTAPQEGPGAREYALKLYPGRKGHGRLESEYTGSRIMHALHLGPIPAPIRAHRGLDAAMYEWIDGKGVTSPNADHIDQALQFLRQLHQHRNAPGFAAFQHASNPLVSGAGFERQLRQRLASLLDCSPEYPELQTYLSHEFSPLMERAIDWVRSAWDIAPGYDEPLPRERQTLSPSDFGFHNTLERTLPRVALPHSTNTPFNDRQQPIGLAGEDNRSALPCAALVFLDFEYFGWDDPAKLIADFILHPGMSLGADLKRQWLQGAIGVYGTDVRPRLRLIFPLIMLAWCMILLNEYRSDVWLARCAADPRRAVRRESILDAQRKRSRDLMATIRGYLSNPQPVTDRGHETPRRKRS